MTLIEHKVGNTLWSEIALKLYPDKLSCFREAIANSLDEGSLKILIDISSDGIFIEDFGAGIDDMDKFVYVGHDSKLTREEENMIGQKGMGKLSLLALGPKVIFLSNNGEVGYKFDMSVKGHERETPGKPEKFLEHKGTKIAIPFPKRIPNIEEVGKFLSKAFGLHLAQGKQIFINGNPLKPQKSLDPEESHICSLKGNFKVTGNLKPVEKNYGRLDVYIQHVFNSNVMIDPTRKFSGWVNCNALEPTASRTDIYEDENGKKVEFLNQLKKNVQRFPRANETGPSKNLSTEMEKLVDKVLKELKIDLKGSVLAAFGNKRAEDGQTVKIPPGVRDVIVEYSKHQQKKTGKKSKRKNKNNSGIEWRNASLGDDSPPIFYSFPNIIIRNTTNTIFRTVTAVNSSLGPVKFRYIPYLARALCAIDPESKSWSSEEYNSRSDKITRVILKASGYLDVIQ